MNPFESPKSDPSDKSQEERLDPMAVIAMMIICIAIAISQLFR